MNFGRNLSLSYLRNVEKKKIEEDFENIALKKLYKPKKSAITTQPDYLF